MIVFLALIALVLGGCPVSVPVTVPVVHNASIPNAVVQGQYPASVEFVNWDLYPTNRVGTAADWLTVERDPFVSPQYNYTYEYALIAADLTYNSTLTEVYWSKLVFAKYYDSVLTPSGASCLPVGFSPYHFVVTYDDGDYYLYSYGLDIQFTADYATQIQTEFGSDGNQIYKKWTFNNSDAPEIKNESYNLGLFDYICAMAVSSQNNANVDGYYSGYQTGYEDGQDFGHSEGYTEGYWDALESGDNSSGHIITSLFAAVFSVPQNVLNGLGKFVIWDTPLIALIITFLFMGFALIIIKRIF